MNNTLVVPTIRKECFLDFKKVWENQPGGWDNVIVVEDSPQKTFDSGYEHYSWNEIDQILGENSWIISRKDSAIRSFGFLMAYKKQSNFIITLDDDCHPVKGKLLYEHIKIMSSQSRWYYPIPDLKTRGIPYTDQGISNIALNIGLWENVPDLDAVQSLNHSGGYFKPPLGTNIVPNGQYFPMCGMNLCFRSEITPLMYFPLMGQGQPFRRFDDIWCGIILKKVTDHLHYNVTVGEPFVNHQKASNVFDNLIKEAPGLKVNEYFWRLIDEIKLTEKTPSECMLEVGNYLEENNNDYIKKLGKAIKVWISLF